ncbi:MAG: extracellular matrix regulator RemB [Saccharofermentanales bacterium]
MYIHIGGEYSIPEKFIVGVFDFDEITAGNDDSLQFLKKAENENRVENVSFDIPRSVIVTVEKVYISPISTRTIRRRISAWIETEHDKQ